MKKTDEKLAASGAHSFASGGDALPSCRGLPRRGPIGPRTTLACHVPRGGTWVERGAFQCEMWRVALPLARNLSQRVYE